MDINVAKTQVVAGFTTFTTMIYISFVIPGILFTAGIDPNITFVLVCIAIGIAGLLNGFISKLPTVLGSSIGLSAYIASLTIGDNAMTWQVAMGTSFWGAVILFICSLTGIRFWLIKAIPNSIKIGIAVGIGLFIGLVGLRNGGIIISHPTNLTQLGNLNRPESLLAILSIIILFFGMLRKWRLSFFISIIATSIVALGIDYLQLHGYLALSANEQGILAGVKFTGIVSLPADIMSVIGQVDLKNSFTYGTAGAVFSFFLINLFDSSGSMIAVTKQANIDLLSPEYISRFKRAILVDSSCSSISSFMGVGSMTTFVESNAGIAVGGRNGLMPITVGILFFILMFFSPIVQFIPLFTTSGALIYISLMMAVNFRLIEWDDLTEALPAFFTAIMMPFTFSISWGIAFGFISYIVMKLLSGKFDQINLPLIIISGLFIINFIFL